MHVSLDTKSNLDSGAYSHEVKKTLWYILFLNWLVAVLKLVFGYSIKSTSMVADGYHSLADGTSNIVGLLGMRIAGQPKDRDHPYGHKKYETFASEFIALLLLIVCFHLMHDSLERFRTRQIPHVTLMSFVVMIVTMGVNVWVMVYERRKGERIGSDILVSDSMHTRADILTSFSVIVAFIGVKLGYPILDSLAAVVIAIFIGLSAINILRSSSKVLCDMAVLDAKEIEKVVMSVEGVRKCHQIRTRGRCDDVHIDLHVLLDDKMPLIAAHEMSSRIEKALKKSFPGVADVIVHMEPLSSEGDDE